MGLEEVKKEIFEKAKDSADAAILEARKEADRILKEAEAQAKSLQDASDSEMMLMLESMERKEISSAEFDVRKMLLDKKKEMISRAFDSAKKKLSSMPEKERQKHISALAEKAGKEIDIHAVMLSSRDKKPAGLSGAHTKTSDTLGGLIAENKDSTIRVDYSYEELLDSVEKENLQEIAHVLFNE